MTETHIKQPKTIGVDEATKILGLSRGKVHELIRWDAIPSFKEHGKRKFLRSDVDAYVKRMRKRAEALAAVEHNFPRFT